MADSIVNAGGTHQLADDNTLCAVDDEGARLSHQGEVAHEDLMLRDLFLFLIIKADSHLQGSSIRRVSFLALFDRILNVILTQLEIHELQAQMAAVVFDWRYVVENLFQPVGQKPVIGVLLDFDQVRHLQYFLLP